MSSIGLPHITTSPMVYRITGGIWFLLTGITMLGIVAIPVVVLGVLALVAGIALLAGA